MMTGPSLDLTDPRWLVCLAALPLLLWFHARGLTDFSARQRRLSLAMRALIFGLVVLALAGLTLERSTNRPFIVFLIDRSDSAGEEATRTAEPSRETVSPSGCASSTAATAAAPVSFETGMLA